MYINILCTGDQRADEACTCTSIYCVQEIRELMKPVHVLPGDSLLTSCLYSTLDRENITLGKTKVLLSYCFILKVSLLITFCLGWNIYYHKVRWKRFQNFFFE